MHLKFHQDLKLYRSYCPLVAKIKMSCSVHNFQSIGWNFMELMMNIYDDSVHFNAKLQKIRVDISAEPVRNQLNAVSVKSFDDHYM